MEHSFDIEIAKEYGILEAILLKNLYFWIEKNKANDKNYYDGYYWTYNSAKAFVILFPYVSKRQIMNALKRLKEAGIIQTGNYNKVTYDRTLWYAFTQMGECIMQKCKMEDVKMSNGNDENVTPIPYINTDINTDDKQNNMQDTEVPDNFVIDLPTNKYNTTGEKYYVTDNFYKDMCNIYQNVDVYTELNRMKGWLITNKTKRKTKNGMEKFINSWLSRNQDNKNITLKSNNTQKQKFTFADINLDEETQQTTFDVEYEIL